MYPIRTVSSLTGVHPVTLRAWERRYGLLKPVRTPKGHRIYTSEHVDLIQRVLALTSRGVPIGRVREALHAQAAVRERPGAGPWPGYIRRMSAAIAAFDEQAIEAVYEEALSLHRIDVVTRELLMPLLRALGERWAKVVGGVAEEHFFSCYLRSKLGARFHHRSARGDGPRLLAACAPGEHHEIGLLLFALAAHEAGLRVVLLGGDMPLPEIGVAARRAQSDAIVISSSVESKTLGEALAALVAESGMPVFVGGASARRQDDTITRAGAVALDGSIDAGVRRIAAQLASRKGKS
ncbi:MAG TPA: MerR family transcriptional regulator [Burkholderiales bacterium]